MPSHRLSIEGQKKQHQTMLLARALHPRIGCALCTEATGRSNSLHVCFFLRPRPAGGGRTLFSSGERLPHSTCPPWEDVFTTINIPSPHPCPCPCRPIPHNHNHTRNYTPPYLPTLILAFIPSSALLLLLPLLLLLLLLLPLLLLAAPAAAARLCCPRPSSSPWTS